MRLLDRYLLRDLVRTLVISVSILVTVIAFGAAIKPLTDDQLLTAWQAAKYMGLAIVPMLQFALPFSAGFAATLTLHRMTADNEVLAMAASGVSYRRILRPVALLGGLLLVIMVALTQVVIPAFWGLMQNAIATDVTRIFEASIARGEPFQVDNLIIYADDLTVQERPDTGADTRLILVGFVAAELDGSGRIDTEITARYAFVDVYRREGQTHLQLAMFDTIVFDRGTMQLSRTQRVAPEAAWTLSHLLEDEPRAMTQAQLLRTRRNPDSFSEVAEARRDLADALRDEMVAAAVGARLAAEGQVVLVEDDDDPRRFTVRADALDGRQFTRDGGRPVEITVEEAGAPLLAFSGRRVRLERTAARLQESTFSLLLEEYDVVDPQTGRTNRRAQLSLTGLRLDGLQPDVAADWSSDALLAEAAAAPPSVGIERRTERLERKLRELKDEIRARLHKRYALCLTAPLLLLLGATLAMWLRGTLPLTIYCWAFVPSILDLILISGGEQMMRDGKGAGLAVLWSGNTIMLVIMAHAFARLSRN